MSQGGPVGVARTPRGVPVDSEKGNGEGVGFEVLEHQLLQTTVGIVLWVVGVCLGRLANPAGRPWPRAPGQDYSRRRRSWAERKSTTVTMR
jgi:hypothetical protein